MAWSPSGFPSHPLPVYISISTKETVKTADLTAPLAVYPRFSSPMAVGVTGPTFHLAVALGLNCQMASATSSPL